MTSPTPTNRENRHQPRRRLPRFKGVRRRSWGKWVAEIRVPNSRDRLWLGSYQSSHQAARAYDVAAACLRGPGAFLNLPLLPLPAHTPACLSPTSIRKLAAQEAATLSTENQYVNYAGSPASSSPPTLPTAPSSTLPLHSGSSSHELDIHGDLLAQPTHNDQLHHPQSSCNDALTTAQQPPAPAAAAAAAEYPPSLLDLWFSLDLSPSVSPHLKLLIDHSLHPANDKY